MHTGLQAALERLQAYFFWDERCQAMYVTGSLAKRQADEFSDIDLAVVVSSEHYATIKSEMQATCAELCGAIAAWLPEGEQAEYVNYAFLFEFGDELLLCDLMLVTSDFQSQLPTIPQRQVLFDKCDALQSRAGDEADTTYTSADLSMTLRTYWVYAYLDGKYFQRDDVYKMLYVQYALFLQHLNLFKAFQPGAEWGWWARDIGNLPAERREDLLIYFGATTRSAIAGALHKALDLFSRDAQTACAVWDLAYPAAMESAVRAHLDRMGCVSDAQTN